MPSIVRTSSNYRSEFPKPRNASHRVKCLKTIEKQTFGQQTFDYVTRACAYIADNRHRLALSSVSAHYCSYYYRYVKSGPTVNANKYLLFVATLSIFAITVLNPFFLFMVAIPLPRTTEPE